MLRPAFMRCLLDATHPGCRYRHRGSRRRRARSWGLCAGACNCQMSRSGPRGRHQKILKNKDTAQQADIQNKQLKCFQVLISLQGQTCSIYTADLIEKAAVGQPQDSGLVFLGASAVTNQTVKELFVFLCQLGGNAVPQHTQLWNDLMGRMLGKVLLICSKDWKICQKI